MDKEPLEEEDDETDEEENTNQSFNDIDED